MTNDQSSTERSSLPDLDTPERIRQFVDLFYQALLDDPQLAPIFIHVAGVDLAVHKPIICSYWQKLLLNDDQYQRHTMNIHRMLNDKQRLQPADFERWLACFVTTVERYFSGDKASRAKRVASSIASNMNKSFGNAPLSIAD